jgi:hypothetical protein
MCFESAGEIIGIIPPDLFADHADVALGSKQQYRRSLGAEVCQELHWRGTGMRPEQADQVRLVDIQSAREFGQGPIPPHVFFHHADTFGDGQVRFGFALADGHHVGGDLLAELGDEHQKSPDLFRPTTAFFSGGQLCQFGGNRLGLLQAFIVEFNVQHTPAIQGQGGCPEHEVDCRVIPRPCELAGEQFHTEAHFAKAEGLRIVESVPGTGSKDKDVALPDGLLAVNRAVNTSSTVHEHDFHEVVVVQGDAALKHRIKGADRGVSRQEKVITQKSYRRGGRLHVESMPSKMANGNIVLIYQQVHFAHWAIVLVIYAR